MKIGPFTTPAMVLNPVITTVKGVKKKTYPEDGPIIYISFKTYGGTQKKEAESNDILTVIDTAKVQTWYRPDILSETRIKLLDDDSVWDVVGRPEDYERRHQYLLFTVQNRGGYV